MDSESQQLFHEYHSEHPSAQCIVCRRDYIPRNGRSEASESVSICRECKSLVADDNEATPPIRNFRRQRRQRRGRAIRRGSSEWIDDLLSQHFSQLLSLVRQQNDSESLDYGDSVFGESDSNASFYGGDSEISEDSFYSRLGREVLAQHDHESHFYTDTDIDPMNAGLDQWDSDEEEDEEDVRNQDTSSSAQNRTTWLRWRVSQADLFADSSDYLDERGFEELLEQFAENDDESRRGAPPASVSAIGSLPRVIISKKHEKNGCLVCAVCKDPLPVGTEAKQLPCSHLYHTACIIPWLNARNSCPVCRYELPTDDPEYEEGRRNVEIYDIQRVNQTDNLSDASSDADAEDGGGDSVTSSSNRRWYFIAAAPIVSIVSIALALWFRNSMAERTLGRVGERDSQQPRHRSS